MAVVAQLVEPRVVISVVVGSSPISRPIICIIPSVLKKLFNSNFASFGNFFRLQFDVFCFLITLANGYF